MNIGKNLYIDYEYDTDDGFNKEIYSRIRKRTRDELERLQFQIVTRLLMFVPVSLFNKKR